MQARWVRVQSTGVDRANPRVNRGNPRVNEPDRSSRADMYRG
jgi:hypothetical protein